MPFTDSIRHVLTSHEALLFNNPSQCACLYTISVDVISTEQFVMPYNALK